jgi:hypothetical protein
MDSQNGNNNLPNISKPYVFFPTMILMTIFIITLFVYLFSGQDLSPMYSNSGLAKDKIVANTLIVLFSTLLFGIVCVAVIPNFKDLKNLLLQISNVFYVILYTISVILLFTLLPRKLLDDYAYIITPITLFFAGMFVYKGMKTDYLSSFNVNYERIKAIILFLCLITMIFVFYSVDPGGYINKSFGYSLILTMLISVFSFLYMIVLLTLQDNTAPSSTTTPITPTSLFSMFSKFSVYGSILFILFLIIVAIGIMKFPGGLFNNITTSAAVLILLLIIVIIWSTMLVVNIFPEIQDKSININKMNLFKRALLMLMGLTTSGLLIGLITYNVQNYSGQSSIPSLLLNTLLIIVVLSLAYKTMNVELPSNNSKKNGFFNLILSMIFYIPCLFTGLFDFILNIATGTYKTSKTDNHTGTSLALIIFISGLSLLYYGIPILYEKINLQGGKLLVNNPVFTNDSHSLATHQQLTSNDNFNYHYGLSSWIYIDSAPPNSNSSYIKYTSLLSYGGKPNILYKANTNTLLITVINIEPSSFTNETNKVNDPDKIEIVDGVPHKIIYKKDNFLLQKWNNIIINFSGGTLDVFLNGELVKSSIHVVPYMTLDTLTIGEKDGVNGGICNVVYFNKPLTRTNIYYLYNMVKNMTPPVTNNNDETIISLIK